MTLPTYPFADAMQDADFVQVDGTLFEASYLRVPDEFTEADDVVIEGRHGEDEVAFVRADVDDATYMGEGLFRLRSGALIRFFVTPVLH